MPVVAAGLGDPEPIVRGHAAWALGKIGTPGALEALRARQSDESDPWVSEEIRAAVLAAGG